MTAVQNGNLNDAYVSLFGQIASGLIARADFPMPRLSVQQFLDIVEPLALAATRRVANTVGDMSTVTPAVTVYDTGYALGSVTFVSPQNATPPPPYVRPTTVETPSGARVPYVDLSQRPTGE